MIRFNVFFVLIFYCSCAFAQSLLKEDDLDLKEVLERAVETFNQQDCKGYSSFFVEAVRNKKQRESGIFFAMNDCKMHLKESHVLARDEESAELAVSYEIDGRSVVSIVLLEKEGDYWKIAKETCKRSPPMEQQASYSPPIEVPVRQIDTQASGSCAGGKCGTPGVPFNVLKYCRDYNLNPNRCSDGSCSR